VQPGHQPARRSALADAPRPGRTGAAARPVTRPTTGERGQPSDPVRLAVPALAPPRSGAMYAEALTRQDGPRPRLVRCPDAATEARLVTDAVLDALDQGRPLRTQAVLMR